MTKRIILTAAFLVLTCCTGGKMSITQDASGDEGEGLDLEDGLEADDVSCEPGLTPCGGACVDLTSDHDNCGACGRECLPEEVCALGECALECPPGMTDCSGSCVDLQTDRMNCGECAVVCGPGRVCEGGECITECSSGLTNCGGSCVDTDSSEEHCGSCYNDCEPDEQCDEGVCSCTPDCWERECGDDGCGDQCPPGCGETETCGDDGQCVPISDCFAWSGSPSLQDAVNAHDCVEIQAGTFSLGSTVNMPANHELRGLDYDRSILVPSSGFDPDGDVAMIVINQSNVLLRKFAVDGSQGGQAKLDVVVLGADTTGVVIEEMRIDGARCDGLSMGGDGTIIRDSTLTNNGYNCPPINTGSAIYAEGNVHIEGGQFSHAPQIIGNVIENNPDGTGIDMAEVSDGVIRDNTIRHCGANSGISIYHGHGWLIEDNDISDSGGWFNYGHPRCEGPTSPATIGIKLCRDGEIAGGTDNNTIRNNKSVGYYGILLAGDDEAALYLVPRFNELTGNDVMGSTVGCLDDYTPDQWEDGDNTWSGNNCRGTPDSGPDYF